ncbi:hypothetical protein TNCT_335221 [Trichonephila clavata]|uniref:Uncharacterized protein n=1 Tax=Trichonephila clavata TaxID=2740835 RepID=A0A8X6LPC5_TRICU|nr:hypothetical protein TNCT_335221 [Trichonephila clavata]
MLLLLNREGRFTEIDFQGEEIVGRYRCQSSRVCWKRSYLPLVISSSRGVTLAVILRIYFSITSHYALKINRRVCI